MSENQKNIVTREVLHEKVWETPLIHLAGQYGVSGDGLAGICRMLNVPYPPPGYWARKAAGKEGPKPPLPEADGSTSQAISIRRAPAVQSHKEPTPEIKARLEGALAETSSISVAERLARPHPVISGWLDDDRRLRLTHSGAAGDLRRRRYRILNTLFKELERRGFRVQGRFEYDVHLEFQGIKIEFQLREKLRYVRRLLTKEEKRSRYSSTQKWAQERLPTGKLLFSVKTFLPEQLRGEWLETDDVPLESRVPEIVAVLVTAAPLLVEIRRKQEAEARRFEEAQARRRQEQNRWRKFNELAEEWRQAQLARDFLNGLKTISAANDENVGDRTIQEWIEWAEAYVAAADPLHCGAEAVFGEIAKVRSWTYLGSDPY